MGLLLTTSIVSVNAFNIEEETGELETSGSYFHAIPVADIYVDDDNIEGSWDGTLEHPYQHIQDGIDNADTGDIVYVLSGTYTKNIIVDKSITLKGEDKDTTIIDGNFVDNTIWVKASYVNIKRFTIINCSQDGFSEGIFVIEKFWWSQNNPLLTLTDISISSCIIENNSGGIKLYKTDTVDISNCNINNDDADGITITSSSQVNINQCEIHDNGDPYVGGIIINHDESVNKISENIVISNCNITGNKFSGISINGVSSDIEVKNNIICENIGYGIYVSVSPLSNILIYNNEIK